MLKKKFKVGDRIFNTFAPSNIRQKSIDQKSWNGQKYGNITKVDGEKVFVTYDDGETGEDTAPYPAYQKVSGSACAKFMLKYDLDTDPIEYFNTLDDVKKRIDNIVQTQPSLKRDSIVVFELAGRMKVSVSTVIKGI